MVLNKKCAVFKINAKNKCVSETRCTGGSVPWSIAPEGVMMEDYVRPTCKISLFERFLDPTSRKIDLCFLKVLSLCAFYDAERVICNS